MDTIEDNTMTSNMGSHLALRATTSSCYTFEYCYYGFVMVLVC